MRFSDDLTAADAAVFETFVVPRYLSLFGGLALEMLLAGPAGRVAHLGCRTGYPNLELLSRFDEASLLAVDGSPAALELAQVAVENAHPGAIEYVLGHELPLPIPDEHCSHAVVLHPRVAERERVELLREAYRVLYFGGQLLFALPLRGSFQELGDLLKEYALKHDLDRFSDQVERMMARRPTIESLAQLVESAGFVDVDVEIRNLELKFDSGRAFADDPVTRLQLVPDLCVELELSDFALPLAYLRDAIDRYWSEHEFGLVVNVGCASGRRG